MQLAPAERADLIVDFAAHRGTRVVLASDAFDLMEFRVSDRPVSDPSALPKSLRAVPRIAESAAVKTRRLTLDESLNLVAESTGMLLNKTPWHAPITEKPVLGTTEIWEFVNLTDDTHPIHLHLVRFQILDRRRFDGFQYMTKGPPLPGARDGAGCERDGLEGHGARQRQDRDTHHRAVRGLCRAVCLALPHPGA